MKLEGAFVRAGLSHTIRRKQSAQNTPIRSSKGWGGQQAGRNLRGNFGGDGPDHPRLADGFFDFAFVDQTEGSVGDTALLPEDRTVTEATI